MVLMQKEIAAQTSACTLGMTSGVTSNTLISLSTQPG